jgi:hypothetical protein
MRILIPRTHDNDLPDPSELNHRQIRIGWEDSSTDRLWVSLKQDDGSYWWAEIVTDSILADAISGISSGGSPRTPFVAGRYYDTLSSLNGSHSTGTYATGTLRATPIYIPNTVTIDRIALGINTSVAQTVRLGIYNDSNGVPGTLLLDAGAASLNLPR